MKNFRTNKTIVLLNIIIFILLLIFVSNEENRQTSLHVVLLSFMVVISFIMVITSLVRKVTITEDKIILNNVLKNTSIDINKISYGYAISAMGRYVLIVNDGSHSIMVSSLMDGFYDLVSLVADKISEDERKSFDIITESSLRKKYIIYAFILSLVTAMLIYGIITSYHLV